MVRRDGMKESSPPPASHDMVPPASAWHPPEDKTHAGRLGQFVVNGSSVGGWAGVHRRGACEDDAWLARMLVAGLHFGLPVATMPDLNQRAAAVGVAFCL